MAQIGEIPKFYVALAEWLGCMLSVLLLRRRYGHAATAVLSALFFCILCGMQYLVGAVPLYLWMPCMLATMALMYGFIQLSCAVRASLAGFYWCISFMFSELIAAFEWKLHTVILPAGHSSPLLDFFFCVAVYGANFAILFFREFRLQRDKPMLKIYLREATSATFIVISFFLLSNLSYVDKSGLFGSASAVDTIYLRLFVNLAGLTLLLGYRDRCSELQSRTERDTIQSLLHRQYEQYRRGQKDIELINRKYHDLKHQIGVIRMEPDADKRERYLQQLENGLQGQRLFANSGNQILDNILASKQLYCQEHNITMNVVADGKRLGFMDEMDICSIMGNALDNAIESSEKLEDTEKRLIQVAVYTQGALLMIRVENYFENPIHRDEEGFRTTKANKSYHGYGIKSIFSVAERYGGTVDISTEDNWFRLMVLIPMRE